MTSSGSTPARFRPYGAVYLFLKKSDQILLLRRQGSNFYDGWFGLPAGHMDGDERATDAMIREAKEEICIDIDRTDLKLVHTMHRLSRSQEQDGTREYLDLWFEADRWTGEIAIGEPHKCDALEWHTLADLPDKTVPYVRLALEAWQRGEIYSEIGWE